MKIHALSLKNYRSFGSFTKLDFSPGVNLLVGPNNSGKSSVIAALRYLQTVNGSWSGPDHGNDLRIGEESGAIGYTFDRFHAELPRALKAQPSAEAQAGFGVEFNQGGARFHALDKEHNVRSQLGGVRCPLNKEPDNLFYYFLSRRKAEGFQEAVNAEAQLSVRPTLSNLPAKVDRLTGGANPKRRKYEEYLQRVLGFQLGSKGSNAGKMPGLFVGDDEQFIPIDRMGEGIPNIAYLLHDLVVAKDRVFLIEEPENDLHPSALVALLDIIQECSPLNQFVVSTHSHIVLSRLGASKESRVFQFRTSFENAIPTTQCNILDDAPHSRVQLLQELGYEMRDVEQWEGVLVLEESSAERVIRDILIPHFAPKLAGRLQTVSASSISKVEMTYDALHLTYLYLHLSPIYKSNSWVRIDGGAESALVIEKLKEKYNVADTFKFRAFTAAQFEEYYPTRFAGKAAAALEIASKKDKREAKRALLLEVLDWALANPVEAMAEFEISANEVIAELQAIQKALLS